MFFIFTTSPPHDYAFFGNVRTSLRNVGIVDYFFVDILQNVVTFFLNVGWDNIFFTFSITTGMATRRVQGCNGRPSGIGEEGEG
jgi:hypothetical protein